MTIGDRPNVAYQLVVFDFDGTLCDSAGVKSDAFYRLFLAEHGSEFAAMVRDYHLSNLGLSRYAKIKHVQEVMLGVADSSEAVETAAARFSSLAEDQVVEAPLFPGVQAFLAYESATTYAIASATPTDELRSIVERKNLAPFFADVRGSPASKSEILRAFLGRFGAPLDAALMVGDQPADAEAAESVGIDFALVGPRASWTDEYLRFDRFEEMSVWLKSRLVAVD